MGEIITFPADRIRPSKAADEGQSVQILFFTGVRYERETEAPPPRRARRRRKRA
jgi:hypothetical protein